MSNLWPRIYTIQQQKLKQASNTQTLHAKNMNPLSFITVFALLSSSGVYGQVDTDKKQPTQPTPEKEASPAGGDDKSLRQPLNDPSEHSAAGQDITDAAAEAETDVSSEGKPLVADAQETETVNATSSASVNATASANVTKSVNGTNVSDDSSAGAVVPSVVGVTVSVMGAMYFK
jgi:hypothetical protein